MARVFFGAIDDYGDDWKDFYRELVTDNMEYAGWSQRERTEYANEFADAFIQGGHPVDVMYHLIEELNLNPYDPLDFDWDAWRSLYEET